MKKVKDEQKPTLTMKDTTNTQTSSVDSTIIAKIIKSAPPKK